MYYRKRKLELILTKILQIAKIIQEQGLPFREFSAAAAQT